MDKKLLSTVIAAALAAPMSAMADATLYGKIHINTGNADHSVEGDEMVMRSHASRLGVKGSEDLGNGLKANFQLEWQVSPDEDGRGGAVRGVRGSGQNGGGDGGFSRRNQWIGLSSDSWGEIRVGRHDHPLKMAQGKFDQFNDTDGDITDIIPGEDRTDNVIAYLSNDFNGFKFAGAMVAGESGEVGEAGDGGLADSYSIAGMYGNGPLFASAGYTSYGGENGINAGTNEPTLWRLVGTYKITDDLMVGGLYSSFDNDTTGGAGDQDAWGLSAKFSLGSNALKFQWVSAETEQAVGSDIERDEWSLGFDHKFSKRTTAYFMYNNDEIDGGNEYDSTSVGVIHKF